MPDRVSRSQRARYERERQEGQRLRNELHAFALFMSPVWIPDNEDDVESALRAVDAYLNDEEGPGEWTRSQILSLPESNTGKGLDE